MEEVTIKIHKEILSSLKKKSDNPEDYIVFLIQKDLSSSDNPFEFKPLNESEVTSDLNAKMMQTKKLPESEFISI